MSVKPRPCKRCRAEIAVERLEAVPGTCLCVKCSQGLPGYMVVVRPQIQLAGSARLGKKAISSPMTGTLRPMVASNVIGMIWKSSKNTGPYFASRLPKDERGVVILKKEKLRPAARLARIDQK